jgi:tRNA A-37 threonylcarbamoyl transferase component Bud32
VTSPEPLGTMDQSTGNSGNSHDLNEVLADFMRRLDRGDRIDPEMFIASHPRHAAELRAYFAQAQTMDATTDVTPLPTSSGALEIRCPSCHTPMEVAVDTALTDLTCSSCGSHFSLVDQTTATRIAPPLSKLGRFELIERLGVGGFGSVWKARDKELDRTVAIKIPRAGQMAAEEQEKFFREARAAAQLRHPAIVSVHEVGRDGDSVYIVSDFVRGVTLGDWLSGQQMTGHEAAELCAKIADALEHAHEQGVIHRDLKPANIMIDADGQPHLMDFGLARREIGEVTVTLDGHILGTPAYMSPEQAEGKGHAADRRSDVYSLGVILFQLLTGELPFRGNARMLMHQVIHDEPPSPRNLNAYIPRDLETITLKCLEKEPTRRYQTAREFADELRRFLSGEPILARRVNQLEYIWRWARRHPVHSTAAVALFIGIVASLLAFTFFLATRKAVQDFRQADVKLKAAQRDLVQASIAKEDAINERRRAQEQSEIAAMSRMEADRQRVVAQIERAEAQEQRKIAEEAKAEAERLAAENAKQAKASAAEATTAKHRELEARIDSLLPDETYTAADLDVLQASAQAAEDEFRRINALSATSRRGGEADVFALAKLRLSSAKARIAWAQRDLAVCSRHYDDAVQTADALVNALTVAYENGSATLLQLADAQDRQTEIKLCASKVKRRLAQQSKNGDATAIPPQTVR